MDNPPHLRGVVVMKGLSYQPYVYNQDNTLRRTLPDTLYRLDCQVASPKNFKNIFVDLLIDLFIICSLFSSTLSFLFLIGVRHPHPQKTSCTFLGIKGDQRINIALPGHGFVEADK